MDTNTRNNKVTELLENFFKLSQAEQYEPLNDQLEVEVEKLFSSSVWGFREILLVIVVGRLLDPEYRASSQFYKCNPRALYEGPIRMFLLNQRIPHRKSGPLNIAKAAEGINGQWAAQRRPSELAESTVSLVGEIEKMNQGQLENLLTNLLARFFKEAVRVSTLDIAIEPQEDPIYLFDMCRNLIRDVPDAGNTPQRIFGLLLKEFHIDFKSDTAVVGYEDRASVTSTTSKKAGDISEEVDNQALKIYEVTVKSFGQSRVDESFDTIKRFDELNKTKTNEIYVICRKEDCHPDIVTNLESSIYLGKLEHEDVVYYFIDIYEWILQQLLRLTPEGRVRFYNELDEYISDPNTAEKVKSYWKELHDSSK